MLARGPTECDIYNSRRELRPIASQRTTFNSLAENRLGLLKGLSSGVHLPPALQSEQRPPGRSKRRRNAGPTEYMSTLSQPAPRQSCKRHSRQDLIVEDISELRRPCNAPSIT